MWGWTDATREWAQQSAHHRDRTGFSWKKWPASTDDHPDTLLSHTWDQRHKPKLTWAGFTHGVSEEVSSRDAEVQTLTPPWSKCDATLWFTSNTEKYNSGPNHLAAFTGRSKITRLQSSCCPQPPLPTKPCSHLQPVMTLSFIFVSF